MLAVSGANLAELEALVAEVSTGDPTETATVSAVNGPRRFVVSGTPAALRRLRTAIEKRSAAETAEIEAKVRGGRPFSPVRRVGARRARLPPPRARPGRRHGPRLGRGLRPRRRPGRAPRPRHLRGDRRLAAPAHRRRRPADPLGRRPRSRRALRQHDRPRAARSRRHRHPRRHLCRSRPALHLRRLGARGGRLVGVRPAPDRPRRRQARRRHRVHPAHRQVADPARRHDPDHRRPRDRRRRRERRPLGRARRWRPGHRGDLRQERRQADRAPRRGPHGAVQHPLPRPLPVEAAGRRPAPAAEGPPRRCSLRRPGDQRRHPRARGRRRHHRGPARGRHHATSCSSPAPSSRSARCWPSPARSTPPSSRTSRAASPAVTTRGRTSTSCCSRRTPTCAPSTTWSSASAAASVRRTAPSTTSPARWATAARRGRHARRRRAHRHRRDGHQGGHHLRRRQAAARRHPRHHLRDGNGGWVGAGRSDGNITSGRSQLGADIHEIDNAASRCGRPARPGRRRRRGRARPQGRADRGDGRHLQALLRRRRRDDLRAVAAPLRRAVRPRHHGPRPLHHRSGLGRLARHHLPRPLRGDAGPRPGARPPRDLRPDRATRRRPRGPDRRHRHARGGVPGGDQLRAAPRRRAVLPRGLPPPGQAGQLRARDRRRRTPLVAVRLAVAGPRRVLRSRPGDRHPRPGGRRRHHRGGRAGRRPARPVRGRDRRRTSAAPTTPSLHAATSRSTVGAGTTLLDAAYAATDVVWAGRVVPNPLHRLRGHLLHASSPDGDHAAVAAGPPLPGRAEAARRPVRRRRAAGCR